ncbi:hypothetical protein BOTBODRAFT_25894 [Botryobasidium botryosum FD-172 SS1]|uniref:Uncharacterized protein n=1 Tax=Botryobasidium botryosum (strain FD-172 SS1) TaxID=930990 RepID=A0A067NCF1_BOTB1|nr:hypothetical protein BOTBODRAFT_25894 [Botryobasidium botryosum FD-172 SS1]
MDSFLKSFTGNNNNAGSQQHQQQGGGGGGIMGALNGALGGGQAGENKEDGLDKAVDWVQEHIFNAGPQNNESAIEQMKDEQISDMIRERYKAMTGRDFPIADK